MKATSRSQYSLCATLSFALLATVTSAPPPAAAPPPNFLLEKIYADTKFNKSLEPWDLSECGRQSTPLCVIFYDMLLTLAAANISISAEEFQPKLAELKLDTFCDEFVATVPSTSKAEATKMRMAMFANKKRQICSTCTIYDADMKEGLKPICGLIYLGYQKATLAAAVIATDNISEGGDTIVRAPVAGSIDVSAVDKANKKPEEEAPPAVVDSAIGGQAVPEIQPKPVIPPKNMTAVVAPTPKKDEPKETNKQTAVETEKIKETTKPTTVNVTANEVPKPVPNEADDSQLAADEREEKNSMNIDHEVNNEDDANPMEEGADDDDTDGAIDSSEDLAGQDINPPVEPPPKPRQDSVSYTNLEDAGPKMVQITDPFFEESESNFFGYFLFLMLVCIVAYVVYHNKSKILALMLEGRRSNGGRGGGGGGRRKHTAAYRKLDSNLEEAITSNTIGEARTQQIIY